MSVDYVSCDLTTLTDSKARDILDKHGGITNIIIGVRPLLFTAYTKTSVQQKMLEGIKTLLHHQALTLGTIRLFVLHISSVAALDHLRTQQFMSEEDAIATLSQYTTPYKIFKRNCEESISNIICRQQSKIPVCHLRLSAIFSDESTCIQCSALDLQCRVGCYLPLPIDCNSSANGIDERFGIGIEDGIRHGSVGLELYIDDSSEGDIRGALTMTGRLQRWHQGRPQRWLVAWRIGEDSISALTKVFNIR